MLAVSGSVYVRMSYLDISYKTPREVSILVGRAKEFEENGFGVVLDKKRRGPFGPHPGWFLMLTGKAKLEAVH